MTQEWVVKKQGKDFVNTKDLAWLCLRMTWKAIVQLKGTNSVFLEGSTPVSAATRRRGKFLTLRGTMPSTSHLSAALSAPRTSNLSMSHLCQSNDLGEPVEPLLFASKKILMDGGLILLDDRIKLKMPHSVAACIPVVHAAMEALTVEVTKDLGII
ncbi:ATP-dependent RNA helicase A isoform X5 [Anser cygnoides]|uniref:ATP-dependent RNA helicase A isoform X5 n=1 Tax=Anser cygnoides TaxID=8845 RepID=UPI0034D3660E